MFSHPQEKGLTSLKRLRTGRYAWVLAFLILVTLGLMGWSLVAVPWYQSVTGKGSVIVYSPMDRPQQVDAQIPGRLRSWYVREGETVKKGQKLALLQDIDSKFLDPQQVERMSQMVRSYQRKREIIGYRLQTLDQQRQATLQARAAALPAARQKIAQNRQKLQQSQQSVVLSRQNLFTDNLQFDRIRKLEEAGLRSRRDYELAQQSLVKSKTELQKNQLGLGLVEQDITMSQLELEKLRSSYDKDLAKIQEDTFKASESLAEVDAQIAKLQIENSGLQQRRLQQVVQAPRDGRVVRLLRLGEGETVKAGDPLCSVMPAVEDPAVELYISDFDAPLVRPQQRVRIMFDGFPAIPFTAFPWAAVGTFGGKVAVVDANDDGSGRYRVLIVPDNSQGNIPWPSPRETTGKYPLRPGTQAQGWIMMERPVPMYWELWRRLNAFPPVPMGDDKDSKAGKGDAAPGKVKEYKPKPVLKR